MVEVAEHDNNIPLDSAFLFKIDCVLVRIIASPCQDIGSDKQETSYRRYVLDL